MDGWTDGCRGVLRGLITQTNPPSAFSAAAAFPRSVSLLPPALRILEEESCELRAIIGHRGQDWGP